MAKGDDKIEFEGVILEARGGGQYLIKVDSSNQTIRAHVSGKMKQNHVRVLPGDRVNVHVSQYDTSHGTIIKRR